ncbi:unnamed protein product [Miscanthus lutarioriparius]|uniref:Uncharacterized protein n=1 Tax=Miscanthus lutarioriparius TaxID=422564 RepID=A0A811QVH8_9POAL|nr:unnamed protein product [Miscanthus lutarioriparius]
MESFKLSSLTLVLTFLLLAAVAVVAGDELTTFIVHVQPQKNQMLATADDRNTWWNGCCDFNGRAVRNNKLIGARSFVPSPNATTNSTSDDWRAPPVEDEGHGTHTASTAAGAAVPGAQALGQAMGTATGIAPRAHVAMYKVCNKTGCPGSAILAAVDAAVGDGCDIISMSLGGSSTPFYQDSVAIATFGAIEKGVSVTMSAGNSGPNVSSVTNEAPWMLTVAAARWTAPFVRRGKPYAELCGNGSLDGMDVRGKIVLCELGGGPGHNITRILKGAVVQSAGGAGMILLNTFPQGYNTLADAHVLPALHVDYAAASAIKSYVNSTSNATAQIIFEGTILGTPPAPSIAAFSSRGPSIENPGILKPDIMGPGVNVLAAWPFQVGPPSAPVLPGPTFNVISGTWPSAPHLSGVVALVKSKHPHCVCRRDPEKAADPGLVYDIAASDYIGYLCGLYDSQNVSVIARRPVDCSAVTVIPESMLNYPSISVAFQQTWNRSTPAVVERTVKNVGEVPSVYYAAVDIFDDDATVKVTPSSLQFTEANQAQNFTVSVWRGQSTDAKIVEGSLRWVSDKHTVRSPVSISFA